METVLFDGGQPASPMGHYSYDIPQDRWTWSDGVYAMHGYAPREVPASTGVLLRHKHPDDRARAAAVLETVVREGGAYSCYHRIVDRDERVRSVLSVGRAVNDAATGRAARIDGYMVDLTSARRTETEVEVQEALARIAEHREVIDQAKGMVMLASGCDSDGAFDIMRECSSNANMKLRDVAYRLVASVHPGCGTEMVSEVLQDLVAAGRHRTPQPAS